MNEEDVVDVEELAKMSIEDLRLKLKDLRRQQTSSYEEAWTRSLNIRAVKCMIKVIQESLKHYPS